MTPEELEKLKQREPEAGPPFQFREGRYYVAMWHVPLADHVTTFGKGGDITAMLWRKNEEPDQWHFLWRFRHYSEGRGGDPWETAKKDRKRWQKFRMREAAEAEVERKATMALKMAAMASGIEGRVECLPIHGDANAFFAAVERFKPTWMHMRMEEDKA